MSLTVKAYLEQGSEPEIRRFVIDQGASSNYEYFSQKVARVFPKLSGMTFRLFWKDEENETIAFDSDEELVEALGCLRGDIFKVYIKIVKGDNEHNEDKESAGVLHPGVTCDGCEGAVHGNRYKCLQCPDYDLCEGCKNNGTHQEHNMTCIEHPHGYGFIPPFWFAQHHGWGGGPRGCGRPRGGWGGCKPQGWGGCKGKKNGGKREWVRKHWEQWQQAQQAAANGGQPQPSTSQQGETTEGASAQQPQFPFGQDFLKNVGEQVAAMLDPLGIDVQVDVEHNGQRDRCGEKQTKTDGATEKQTSGPNKGDAMETEATASSAEYKKGSSSPDSGSGEDEWTMVHGDNNGVAKKKSPEPTQGGAASLYPDLPPVDPHISQAREQMLAMGFRDDDGWLTRLLISTNGDIPKALDTLRPGRHN